MQPIDPLPPFPSSESERTSCPKETLLSLDNETIEKLLEECQGKIQIFENEVTRDPPVCHQKSYIAGKFLSHYTVFTDFMDHRVASGTSATYFRNGWLLAPEMSVWLNEEIPDEYTCQHILSQSGTAPAFVMECEWQDEIYQTRKGHDKIVNYFFAPQCVGAVVGDGNIPTMVREAWLVVIPRHVVVATHYEELPRLRWFIEWIPIVSFVIKLLGWCLLVNCVHIQIDDDSLDGKLESHRRKVWLWLATCVYWFCYILFDVIEGEDNEPPNPVVLPYIVVYFRNQPYAPKFYSLRPNAIFLPPMNSLCSCELPLMTNSILCILEEQ